MDYLTRLFLELEETQQADAPAFDGKDVFRRSVPGRRSPQAKEGPADGSSPEEQTEFSPVRQLRRILDRAQGMRRSLSHAAASVHRQPAPAESTAVPGAAPFGMHREITLKGAQAPDLEAFSRFFERDSRRY